MAKELARRKLGQSCPADTNVKWIAVPSQPNWRYKVEEVTVANNVGTTQVANLFHSPNGLSGIDYSLLYGAPVLGNEQVRFEGGWYVNPGEAIGIQSDLARALTFTLFGIVEELSATELGNLE